MAISIKDIAEKAGVAPSTVSRALSDHPRISQETKERIQQLATEMGYSPSAVARSLVTKRTHTIGLAVAWVSDPFLAQLVRGAEDTALEHGYTVFLSSFYPDWLADAKALAPEIAVSVLFGSIYIDPVAIAQAVGAEYVHPAWENRGPEPHRLLTDAWIARVRAAGLGIICWHEERPAEIAALRRRGVDGICSDTPDRLL